jgi:anaerobic magnesium-protoporphyrin IX monomethyl ester cyclase
MLCIITINDVIIPSKDMYKIALVNPPQFTEYPQPPMGLLQLAAVLESKGYRVSIIDANALKLQPRDVVPLLGDTDVVGLTAMTPTISRAIEIARYIKGARPEIPLILGGSHATLLPGETLTAAPEIDVIVRGEGEETIVELLTALENKQSLGEIQGITYSENGKTVDNPLRSSMIELDSLPFLAYHLLHPGLYRPHPPHGRALPFAVMITSRGCPYKCAYCSKPVFGKKFRAQSPERVVDEIAYLQEKRGIKELAFYDDVFTMDKKRAYAVAEEILKRGGKIIWSCETRVNLVDRELLRHMKQAGCYSVSYGIESGSQEILDTIDKDITLEQVEEAVRFTREAGLHVIGYFMVGSPGETPATIRQTVGLARKLKLDFAQFSITTPFPGTKFYEMYLEGGGDSNIPWEDYIYAGSGGSGTPVFESPSLRRDDIFNWVKRAYREFYLRPSYIWRRLRRTTSIGDLKVNLSGLSMLLSSVKSSRTGQ